MNNNLLIFVMIMYFEHAEINIFFGRICHFIIKQIKMNRL